MAERYLSRSLWLMLFFQVANCYPETFDSLEKTNTSDLKNEHLKQNVEIIKTNNSIIVDTQSIQESSQNYSNESLEIEKEDFLAYIYPNTWTWILIICHCVVFVVGLVGNCLVCVAVYRNHTMRTVTNYFIVNLAAADFLVILFCLPPSVVWDVTLTWWFGTPMCKIVLSLQVVDYLVTTATPQKIDSSSYAFMDGTSNFAVLQSSRDDPLPLLLHKFSVSVTVSVLTLTFISIDRWYAICFPLKFKSTTGRAKTAIGIIWVIAMVCEIPEPITLRANPYNNLTSIYFTQCAPDWSKETDTIFMGIKMIFFYIIPLVFMSIAYVQIIRVLWKSGNAPHQAMDLASGRMASCGAQLNTFAMNMNTSTEGQLKSRRKAAKMLVAVMVMFAICFLPVHLLSVLRLTVKLSNSDLNRTFALISHWLCYANSAVNPIIYNFMSGKFRKEFRRAFDTCFQREQDRHYYQSGGTFYNKDSGFASRTQSRNDCEIHRLSTFKDQDTKLIRKGTRTSMLQVDI